MKITQYKTLFPWISVIATACVSTYFYFLSTNNIELKYFIPDSFQGDDITEALLQVLALVFLLDFLRFRRHKKSFNKDILEYDKHVQELLKSKSNLQTKALKYSDHADKLKLFISDRLLEHIEYDEKFLHFKNIASEVRHNGVISYDKVKTALETAMENEADNNPIYAEALISMRYLWDLLDLSTTDNIAMYVANKLYDAEEVFFQKVLKGESHTQAYSPTFFAYDAVIAALPDFVEKNEIQHDKNKSRRKIVRYNDNKLVFELEKSIQILGNMNYLVLLIENLLNNALFYLNKKIVGNKYTRISVTLKKSKKNALLRIYNPGPLIDNEVKDKIFELGFSTRRNKENNGKGLGLYFVNQIAKGNEGDIYFDNITNINQSFSIQIDTDGDKNIDEIIDVFVDENHHLHCETESNNAPFLEYNFKSNILNISITVQASSKSYTLVLDEDSDTILFDPENPGIPRWCVEYFKLKTMNKIVFRPLNITGVQFTLAIPTAESRLEVDYHELESTEINKLENPDVKFEHKDGDLYK